MALSILEALGGYLQPHVPGHPAWRALPHGSAKLHAKSLMTMLENGQCAGALLCLLQAARALQQHQHGAPPPDMDPL